MTTHQDKGDCLIDSFAVAGNYAAIARDLAATRRVEIIKGEVGQEGGGVERTSLRALCSPDPSTTDIIVKSKSFDEREEDMKNWKTVIDLDNRREIADSWVQFDQIQTAQMAGIIQALVYVGDCIRWHGLAVGGTRTTPDGTEYWAEASGKIQSQPPRAF